MKKVRSIIFIITLFFFTFTTYAYQINIGIDGSLYYSPLKNYNDYITSYEFKKIGFGPEIGIHSRVFIREKIILQTYFSYFITKSKRENEKVESELLGYHYVTCEYTFTAFSIMLDTIYYFNPKSVYRFYIGAGLGVFPIKISSSYGYKVNKEDTELSNKTSDSDTHTCYGCNILGGMEYFINSKNTLSLNCELKIKFTDLKIKKENNEEIYAGFNGAGIIIGISYYL